MKYLKARLIRLLVNYFDNDDRRIEHALHVMKQAEQLITEDADKIVNIYESRDAN